MSRPPKAHRKNLTRAIGEFVDRSIVGPLARHHLEREMAAAKSIQSRLERENKLLKKNLEELGNERDKERAMHTELHRQAKQLRDIKTTAEYYKASPTRHQRIETQIRQLLDHVGISKGSILEIGGRKNAFRKIFPGFQYTNLDIDSTDPDVLVADITACPEIASNQYDAIISIDVFEHIDRPWLAASEIVRLLKPGGATYHSTLFSWRYHPCPIDYWRFTPDALRFIFSDLSEVFSGFDTIERRRNNLGKGKNLVPRDPLGGWRENWRVFFGGTKPVE